MIAILTIIFFVFGTIIGSFLNVVILRFNTGKTVSGRSACMSCERQLAWYDMVPIASYAALRGRCRMCKTRISAQYPLVELATGLVFAALFHKFAYLFFVSTFAFTLSYAYYGAMFALLIVIAAYDLRHKIIPDALSYAFGVLAFLGLFFFSPGSIGIHMHVPTLSEALAGLVLSVPFALLWFFSRGAWMGLGDAKLAVGLGFLLGTSRLLSGAVLAFWAGAIIGIILLAFSKKYGMKTEVPFAPFLVLGAVIAFFCQLSFFAIGS
ncbi:MAG: prepilin peptidase [bacterium]